MVLPTKTPQGSRLNPQNTLELSQGMSIQEAIDTADAHGGNWTLLLYPGAAYDEGDITPDGGADITIKAMGEGRVIIAPTAIPAAGVIVSGHTLTLEDVMVIAPDATRPAIRVTAGNFHSTRSIFTGVGAGDVIQQVGGTIHWDSCEATQGNITLDTDDSTLIMHRGSIENGNIVTAGGLGHTVTLTSLDLNGNNFINGATGAGSTTTVAIEKCINMNAFTDASELGTVIIEATHIVTATKTGTSPWTITVSEISTALRNDNAVGGITVYVGGIGSVLSAVGSIVWYTPSNRHLFVLKGMLLEHALAVAVDGDQIRLDTGTFIETGLVITADLSILGEGTNSTFLSSATGGTILSAGAGIEFSLAGLSIIETNAGVCLDVTGAAVDGHLDSVNMSTTADAIVMTNGELYLHACFIQDGDIELSAALCTLTMITSQMGGGDLNTAGAFDHVVTLTHCNMGGNNIVNGATGATTIVLTYVSDVNTFSDAGLLGTVLLEHSFTLVTTKTGTSPWTVRVASIGVVSNANAAGAITIFGGFVYACAVSTGAIIWYNPEVDQFQVIENMEIADTLAVINAGDIIKVGPGIYALAAQLARAIDDVTIIGSGIGTRITLDGFTPVITAGAQDNWLLANFDTDAGSVLLGGGNNTAHNLSINGAYSTVTGPVPGITQFPGQEVIRVRELRHPDPAADEPIQVFGKVEYQTENPTFATPNFISELLNRQGRTLIVPTSAGWSEAVGVGGAKSMEPVQMDLSVVGGGADTIIAYCLAAFSNVGLVHSHVDWDNELVFAFDIARLTTNATVEGRVQLKAANAIGILAQEGVGLQVINYGVRFEQHNGGRTVSGDDVFTLTDADTSRIIIWHVPGVGDFYYINGVLVETLTANIPAGDGGAACYWCMSLDDGGTGAACHFYVSPILVWNHL